MKRGWGEKMYLASGLEQSVIYALLAASPAVGPGRFDEHSKDE